MKQIHVLLLWYVLYATIIGDAETTDMRIAGGTKTTITKYPSLISIQSYDDGHMCGGTLLGDKWVLTAAHCVLDFDTNIVKDTSQMYVVAGRTNSDSGIFKSKDDPGMKSETRKIFHMFPHPEFKVAAFNYLNDIAIIMLMAPINETENNIKYVKLPTHKSTDVDLKGPCTAVGWGDTLGRNYSASLHGEKYRPKSSPQLREADVPLITTASCLERYNVRSIKDYKVICAHSEEGKDTCEGDSGGPLFCGEGKVRPQVGIVSWGKCREHDTPGVYARVDNYLDWIEKMTGLNIRKEVHQNNSDASAKPCDLESTGHSPSESCETTSASIVENINTSEL